MQGHRGLRPLHSSSTLQMHRKLGQQMPSAQGSKQAVANQLCTRRDDFCFCSPRVFELIWDRVDQSCRSWLLHSIPLTTFSFLFLLESCPAKRTESINNSISASFMKARSLLSWTPHTTFYNEGKNPKYKSVSLTSFAHETSYLFQNDRVYLTSNLLKDHNRSIYYFLQVQWLVSFFTYQVFLHWTQACQAKSFLMTMCDAHWSCRKRVKILSYVPSFLLKG